MKDTLNNQIKNQQPLTETEIDSLVDLLGKRCRQKKLKSDYAQFSNMTTFAATGYSIASY